MKRRLAPWDLLEDDRGIALTEFVIVIPIVLLFFFAMLQHFADFEASQLGNYAAFMAGRVYAVDNSVDPSGSQAKALRAASWALAPVAGPVPGELSLGGILPNFALPAGVAGNSLARFAVGYLFAEYGRFGFLGGSVTCKMNGSPAQVDTVINYPQPVFIPGFAPLWDFVWGDKIYYSLKQLRQGLTGVPGAVLPFMEDYNELQQTQQQLGALGAGLPTLPELPEIIMPYINIQSKGSIGYENWQLYPSSGLPNGGPRLPPTDDATDGTTSDSSTQNLANQAQQGIQDAGAYNTAQSAATTACGNLQAAQAKTQTAQTNYNQAVAAEGQPATAGQQAAVQSAQGQLTAAQGAQADAQSSYDGAEQNVATAQQKLAADGTSPPSASSNPCSP